MEAECSKDYLPKCYFRSLLSEQKGLPILTCLALDSYLCAVGSTTYAGVTYRSLELPTASCRFASPLELCAFLADP